MNMQDKIIVTNTGDDSLSIIDPLEMKEQERIYLGNGVGPSDVVVINNSTSALIVQSYANSLAYYDLLKKKMKKSFFVGSHPCCIVIDGKGLWAYIVNSDSDSVSIISKEKVRLAGQISVGFYPQGLDCHPNKPLMAVANMNSQDVWLLETEEYRVEKIIRINGYPCKVRFSRDGRYMFVTYSQIEHPEEGGIVIIDLKSASINYIAKINAMPSNMYETLDGHYLVIASTGVGGLEVIDIPKRRVMPIIQTNGMAHDVAADPHEKYMYVTNTDDQTVSVIDWNARKKVTDIAVGKEPNGICYISG
jgi:YVTN family beta-propeller protein